MKIDQDIRAAIRSAEKLQADTDSWEVRQTNEQKSIRDFFAAYPAKAKRAKTLATTIRRAAKTLEDARGELCESFGLREMREKGKDGFTYASCDSERKKFEKAGGKVVRRSERWKFDAVMAELAAATPDKLKPILKKYGINWD